MALANILTEEVAGPKLQTWLRNHHPDAAVTSVEVPKSSGLSAETIMFTAEWGSGAERAEHRLVARVQPTGPALFMKYDFPLEFAVLKALSTCSNIPVPEVLFLEKGLEALGAPFYIMTRLDGNVAQDDPPFTLEGWVLDLEKEDVTKMCENGIAALVALHDCDTEALGLDRLINKPEDGPDSLTQLINQWKAAYEWSRGDQTNELIEYGFKWLLDNAPAERNEQFLSWGDSRIGNMMFSPTHEVSAILDWEMVSLGAREVDLAWWIFLNTHHSVGVGASLPAGFLGDQETIAKYEELSGYKVKNMDYYLVLAGVRMSILILRAANLMIGAGLLPPDSEMGRVNPAANLTADLLGVTTKNESAEYYFGNR